MKSFSTHVNPANDRVDRRRSPSRARRAPPAGPQTEAKGTRSPEFSSPLSPSLGAFPLSRRLRTIPGQSPSFLGVELTATGDRFKPRRLRSGTKVGDDSPRGRGEDVPTRGNFVDPTCRRQGCNFCDPSYAARYGGTRGSGRREGNVCWSFARASPGCLNLPVLNSLNCFN